MSKKLNELLQERASVYEQLKALDEKYDGKAMETADADTYGNLEAQFDALTGKIEAQKRADKRDRMMVEPEKKPEDSMKGPSLFAKALSGRAEDIQRFMNETPSVDYTLGTNATAGYLTAPVQFREDLIKGLDDDLFMRQISKKIGGIGAAQSLGFPAKLTGATDATWTSEVGDATEEQDLTFGRREFKPNRLAKLLKISRTLMNHAPMAEGTLLGEIRANLGVVQEKAYMTGDGSGKPLGVFVASNSGIPTTRDVATGNTTTAITLDGVLNALYSIKGQYHRRANWIFHRDAIKMLRQLKDGEGQYLWQPSVQAGQPDMLYGHPVHMSEFAPNTFTTGKYVGIVGDFNHYWICDADTLAIQILRELYAVNNQTGYIYEYFGDGAPVVGEAFARVKLA